MNSKTSLLALALLVGAPAAALAAPPQNAVGEVLAKARADGFKRVLGDCCLRETTGQKTATFVELRYEEEYLRTEYVELRQSGTWDGERFMLGYDGVARGFELARGKELGKVDKDRSAKGEFKDGKTLLKIGDKTRELPLAKGPVVNLVTAVVVLPAYYDAFPADLSFAIFRGGETIPGCKLAKGKLEGDVQAVELTANGQALVTIHVSAAAATKGKVLSLSSRGSKVEVLGKAESRKLLESLTAKAKLKAAQDANKTFDLSKLAAHFRDHGKAGSQSQELWSSKTEVNGKVVQDRSFNRYVVKDSADAFTIRYLEYRVKGERKSIDRAHEPKGTLKRSDAGWTWTLEGEAKPDPELAKLIAKDTQERNKEENLEWTLFAAVPSTPLKVGQTWNGDLTKVAKALSLPFKNPDATSYVKGVVKALDRKWLQIEVTARLAYPAHKALVELTLKASLPVGPHTNGHIEGVATMDTPDGSKVHVTLKLDRVVPK